MMNTKRLIVSKNLSKEEYDSWVETLEVMNDVPDILNDLNEVKRDIASGANRSYLTLDQILARNNLI